MSVNLCVLLCMTVVHDYCACFLFICAFGLHCETLISALITFDDENLIIHLEIITFYTFLTL